MNAFHFLRPEWLLGLVASYALYRRLGRHDAALRPWRGVVEPHLLEHLIVGGEQRSRFAPGWVIPFTCALACVALAGPTWEREPTPFREDTAPLLVALDVSQSMNAIDVQPTRLERAKHKVRDLLALRPGARTGLVAFAGSAHVVLPPCDDPSVLETLLDALETKLMPVQGQDPEKALDVAERLLAKERAPGTILFVTDATAIPAGHGQHQTLHLPATPDGFTIDTADVESIQRQVRTHLEDAYEAEANARWRDRGYPLVFPIALLSLLWFRRGWTLRWDA